MSFWRHHLSRLVGLVIVLLMLGVIAPTVSRAIAAADPVRAVMLAEICATAMPSAHGDDTDTAQVDSAGVHCPACLAPALGALLPEQDARADYLLIAPRSTPALRIDFVPDAAAQHPPLPARAPPARA